MGKNRVLEATQLFVALIITGFDESVHSIESQDMTKNGTSPRSRDFTTLISLLAIQSNVESRNFP